MFKRANTKRNQLNFIQPTEWHNTYVHTHTHTYVIHIRWKQRYSFAFGNPWIRFRLMNSNKSRSLTLYCSGHRTAPHIFGCEFRHHNSKNKWKCLPPTNSQPSYSKFNCFVLKICGFFRVDAVPVTCLIFPFTQEERQKSWTRDCVVDTEGHEIKLPCHCWLVGWLAGRPTI